MSTEFDRQELESCLAKCVVCCGLRDLLTKTGIASDEPVELHIEYNDNLLVRQDIPKKSTKIAVAQQATDFGEEINDFFIRAEASNHFLSKLPKSEPFEDGSTSTIFKVTFNIGSFQCGKFESPRMQMTMPLDAYCVCRDPSDPSCEEKVCYICSGNNNVVEI